jgi:hypothetical protein
LLVTDANRENSWDQLLERLSIEGLAEPDWRELATKVVDDDRALLDYIETVCWQQSLAHLVGNGSPPPQSRLQLLDEATVGETRSSGAKVALPNAAPASPSNSLQSSDPISRRTFRFWAIAVGLAFVAGSALTAATLHFRSPAPDASVAISSQQAAPIVSVKPAPFVQESLLGKVSALSLEASAEGLLRSLQVGQELRCGEVVQFTTGHMRVALHSGPELIIEGPAEFSIIGTENVFVRVGQVAVTGAENLLLQSPLLTAECNDADVSFAAEEDTTTKVYAHKGVVTMRSVAGRRTRSDKLAVLHEGQGLLVRSSGDTPQLTKTSVESAPTNFRRWSQVEARLTESQRLVLSDRPVAYWPLYRVRRNRRVLDLTQHGYDGQAIGNWPAELNDAAKNELGTYFNGECYIEPDRKPPLNLRSGFTVEGWAKVSGGPEYQSIFTSRWVLDAHAPHLQCLGFTLYAGKNDRWQLWTGSGNYGQLWKELHADEEFERHRWTHVVGTFDPLEPADGMPAQSIKGTVRIYADGKLVAEDIHEMSLLDFEWPARIGAAEFVPKSLTAWLFRGHLRDIAVYNYPLEPARIQAHYEAGKSAG